MKEKHPVVDWKIVEAPDPDEAYEPVRYEGIAAAPLPRHGGLGLPRRAGILIGSVIILLVVGTGLYAWWSGVATRLAIQRAITREADIIVEQDKVQIKTMYGVNDSDWDKAYTKWAVFGQAAPRPLPFLYPLTTTGQLTALNSFAPNVLRAEVARPYSTAAGQVLTFTTIYFFSFVDDAWQRIEPPADYWGEKQTYVGPYLTMTFWEPDQPLVDELGPFLDDLLNQICLNLECPLDYKFELDLTDNLPSELILTEPDQAAQPADPLLFDLVLLYRLAKSSQVLRMSSPRVMGYPTDEASFDLYRRAIGWQILGQTSTTLSLRASDSFNSSIKPIHWGLVAEMGRRLGLDSAPGNDPIVVDDLAVLDRLGQGEANFDTSSQSEIRSKLRAASAMIHHLLRDEPSGTEARLLQSLWEHPTGLVWLNIGLGLSPTESRTRLEEVVHDAIKIQSRVSGDFDLALGCNAGPAVISLEDGEIRYLLSDADDANSVPYASAVAWAADGQRVLFSTNGLLANLSTGHVDWLTPYQSGFSNLYIFLNQDLLAYLNWAATTNRPSLRFRSLSDSDHVSPVIEDVWDFAVSPDRQWIAITQLSVNRGGMKLSLIPATGGPPLWEGEGAFASWSPDSQHFAYGQYGSLGNSIAFHIFDLASGASRVFIEAKSDAVPLVSGLNNRIVWSPKSDQLAIVTETNEHTSYLRLVSLNKSVIQASLLNDTDYIFPPRFSADGQFIAVFTSLSNGDGQLQLIEVASGKIVRMIKEAFIFDWSATGHQLAVAGGDGLYWLPDPFTEPEKLSDDFCYSVAWNPTR